MYDEIETSLDEHNKTTGNIRELMLELRSLRAYQKELERDLLAKAIKASDFRFIKLDVAKLRRDVIMKK